MPLDNTPMLSEVTGTITGEINVLPSLTAGADHSAQQIIQSREVAGKLNRSPQLVRDSLPESQRQLAADTIAQNPDFAGWVAQSPDNASIALDDVDGLMNMFGKVGMIRQMREGDALSAKYGTIEPMERGFSFDLMMRDGFSAAFAQTTLGTLLREGMEGIQDSTLGAALLYAEAMERDAAVRDDTEREQWFKNYAADRRKLYKEIEASRPMPLEFEEGTINEYTADLVRQAPQWIVQYGLGAATGGGLTPMLFMGSQAGGGKYLDLTGHYEVDKSRAMKASIADAAMQMVLERIGMDRFLRAGKVTGTGRAIKHWLTSGALESGTEFLQAYPEAATTIWALAEKEGRSGSDSIQKFMDDFGEITDDGLYEALLALPFGMAGGGGRFSAARRAKRYAEAHKELHASVEATKIKEQSPLILQDILEQNGITENQFLPAEYALELYQSDPLYGEAFGLSQEQIVEAAAMGHDIEVSAARLHARLDREQYARVGDYVRQGPENVSLHDVTDEGKIAEQAEVLTKHYEEQTRQQEAYDSAMEDLRGRFAEAGKETPGLATQQNDIGNVSALLNNFASRMYPDMTQRIDFINRVDVKGAMAQELLNGQRVFMQPLNPDVDPNMSLPVVDLSGTKPLKITSAEMKRFVEDWKGVLLEIGREATGKYSAKLSQKSPRHPFWSSEKHGRYDSTRRAALADLEKVLAGAVRIEDMPAKHPGVGKTIRFYVPVSRGGGNPVAMRIVAHEMEGKIAKIDGVELYDIIRERPTPPEGTKPSEGPGANVGGNVERSSAITVRQMLEGVKDGKGKNYFQFQKNEQAKGQLGVTKDGRYVISLFAKADLSTLVHETAHIFKEEMERLREAGLADEALLRDMDTLDTWLGKFEHEYEVADEYHKHLQKHYGKHYAHLTQAEKEHVKEIVKHEYFARGFEKYLREGKAPSEELRSVFSRFKHWLLKIYRSAKSLGVEIHDEVRGVFDRMLASEWAIEKAAADNELFTLTKKELDTLKVEGIEREFQGALISAAKRRAVEMLERVRNKERKERRAAWAKEAREAILQDPLYAARQELYKEGGFLDRDMVAALYGEEAVKAIRRKVGIGAIREGGQDPQIFAAQHGFEDGAAMIGKIVELESVGKRTEKMVNMMEAEYESQLDPSQYILDTEEIVRQTEKVGEYIARNLQKEPLTRRAFAQVASEQLAQMPMGKAKNDGQFTAAMRRALRKERVSIGKGDFEAAMEANTQVRLNLEFARQGREIKRLQESTTKAAKRFVGMKKADPVARYIVNDMAARFELMPYDTRVMDGKDADTITNWLKERQEEGFTVYLNEGVLRNQTGWQDLSVADFQEVADGIAQVITVERNARKMLTAQDKASFAERIDKAVETIHSHRQAKPIKTVEEDSYVAHGLRQVHALHTKIETLCIALDGGAFLGENWQLIYKPINDAENRRGIMFKALSEKLNSKTLFGAYTQGERTEMARKKVYEPSIGESITHEQRLMVALNMGNEGNYNRLLDGRNWTEEQAAKVVEPLSKRDWGFVQGVWDVFESYREEAFALQEDITGMRPSQVKATPIMTKFGEMRGGYFPVMYDQKHAKADLQEKLITSENPTFAMTKQGHLKERNSRGAGTPLDLSLSAIPSRLNDVVTDLCFRRAYLDVGRTLRNTKYSNAIKGTVGFEQYESMVSWFKDAAKINNKPSPGDKLLRWGRMTSTMMAMGYKFTTMLAQPFGMTQSIELIGSHNMMKGLNMAFGKGAKETIAMSAWVKSVSPFMEQRIKSFDREVADATIDFSRKSLTPDTLVSELTSKAGLSSVEQWVKKNAFVPMGMVQYGVDLPTWLGAYQKGLIDFKGHEGQAIEYADSVVRLSQGSGQNKDLARIQRGGEALKAFTMFYTYFNSLYNLTALRVGDVNMHRDGASVMRAANSFLLLYLIPSILTEIVAGRGPDDDEDFWAWSAKQVIMYPMQTLAFGRTFAGAIEAEYGYTLTPAEKAPRELYNFIVMLNKGLTDKDYTLDGKKALKQSVTTLGYMSGIPLGQAEISAFNIWDYLDGTSEDYELRDLFFRRPKSRR